MSWYDYVFEDPMESYERCMEDDSYSYSPRWRRPYKEPLDRECTRCSNTFSSAYPQACPECGGWTQEV